MKISIFKTQVLPIAMTVVVAVALIGLTYGEIVLLNGFTKTDIELTVRWYDVLVGLTIYLKTSIDFAIFIGHLMSNNTSWKGRIAIELGSAIGNAAGTLIILAIWTFFKEVLWLLALMILIASLVLFRLAEDSFEHVDTNSHIYPSWFRKLLQGFEKAIHMVNTIIAPVLSKIVPNIDLKSTKKMTFWALFGFSFTVPFILGLDDFAGYVPLFSIVNVLGFAIGVISGHMILNMLLYISPTKTIKIVKNPIFALLGSIAFVALGAWGIREVFMLIQHMF